MWMTGDWLLVTSATFVESMPRYSLTMFPIFMLFAVFQKPFLERPDHGLVAALPGTFCQFFCQRLVGVLESAFYLFQSSAPFLTA